MSHSEDRRRRARRSARVAALGGAVALAVASPSSPAAADEAPRLRLGAEWNKLADVLRDPAVLLAREPERPEPPLFRTTPQMSVVARDWGASQSLFGPLGPTDQLRLSHSLRMVVARVRLGGGRITPFAQVGFGQWRVDTSVVAMPNDVELAGQIGGGLELHVAPGAVVALESSCTMLYRDASERPAIPLASPSLWAGLLAARARF
jgi:hypothetical protein